MQLWRGRVHVAESQRLRIDVGPVAAVTDVDMAVETVMLENIASLVG